MTISSVGVTDINGVLEGVGVSVSVGVGVSASGSMVAVGGGVTKPPSTRACAVSSITVGSLSSGIKVGKGLPGSTEQPAVKPTAKKMMRAYQQRFIIGKFLPSERE